MATTIDYNQTPGSISQGQHAPVPSQTSKACVMVVEDHEDTRFLIRTLLEMRGGISVIEAENGEMAIALARNVRLDLILMDTNLPLLDGYKATRRIRELTSTSAVPIVMLSGYAEPAAEAKAFAAGCNDFLVKPFALGELGNMLERHLSQSKRH